MSNINSKTKKKGVIYGAKKAWKNTKRNFQKMFGVYVSPLKKNSQPYLEVSNPPYNRRISKKPRQLHKSSSGPTIKQQSPRTSNKRQEINESKLFTIVKLYEIGDLVDIGTPQKHLFYAKITMKIKNGDGTDTVYFIPIITIQNDIKLFNISANLSSANILSEYRQKQIDTDNLIRNLLINFTLVSFFRNDEKCFTEELDTNHQENKNTKYLTNNIISLRQINTLHDLKNKLAIDKATTKSSRKYNCNTRTQFVYTLVFIFMGDNKKYLYVPILVSYPSYSDNESDEVSYSLITDKSQIPEGVTVNNDVNVETLNNMADWLDYKFYETYVGGGKQKTP
jgi:hypothetical protein